MLSTLVHGMPSLQTPGWWSAHTGRYLHTMLGVTPRTVPPACLITSAAFIHSQHNACLHKLAVAAALASLRTMTGTMWYLSVSVRAQPVLLPQGI
jgi:hypothetical protein